jgi:hypothetical protein
MEGDIISLAESSSSLSNLGSFDDFNRGLVNGKSPEGTSWEYEANIFS